MGRDRPPVVAGVALLAGYFQSWIRRAPRVEDPEVIAFLRRKQLRRLFPLL
jgi:hypothetical protein